MHGSRSISVLIKSWYDKLKYTIIIPKLDTHNPAKHSLLNQNQGVTPYDTNHPASPLLVLHNTPSKEGNKRENPGKLVVNYGLMA